MFIETGLHKARDASSEFFYFSAGGLQGSCLFVKRLTDGATLVWRAGLQSRSRRLVNVSCPEVFRCFIGMTGTLCFLLL